MAVTQFLALRAAAGLDRKGAASFLGVRPSVLTSWETIPDQAPQSAIESLSGLCATKSFPRLGNGNRFSFIDLFAGIGGMRQAFETAGGRCKLTSEWNAPAVETYAANFGASHPFVGDIRTIDATNVPDHDILVAGFPCQAFSIAGVSKKNSMGRPHGFEDKTQGTLFFEVARILKEKRPAAFVLENVRNLTSHDRGRTFQVILETLRHDLGYAVSSRIIDARSWVPQGRQRIFIVGFREGPGFDFDTVNVPDAKPTMSSILHTPGEPGSSDCLYAPGGIPDPRFTLTDGLWRFLQSHAEKHRSAGNGFGFGLVGPSDVARTLSARYYKDGSEILVQQEGRNPRRLTPRECARLMGFDQPGVPQFRIPVSTTQAYKQFGNSVVVPAVTAIAEAVARRLHSAQPLEQSKRKEAA